MNRHLNAQKKVETLEKQKSRIREFLESNVEEMVLRKIDELRFLGVDVDRPEIARFIEEFKKTAIEGTLKDVVRPIDDEIDSYRPPKDYLGAHAKQATGN